MVATPKLGEDLEGTLAHYGIKGMRWGVRRSQTARPVAGPEEVLVAPNRKTGGLQTAGGRGHKPSEDAIKAAALRQKAKASGPHALSNKEMQDLITRLNLETNYKKAIANNQPPKTKGQKYMEAGAGFLSKAVKGEVNARVQGKEGDISRAYKIFKSQTARRAARKAGGAAARTVSTKVLTGKIV